MFFLKIFDDREQEIELLETTTNRPSPSTSAGATGPPMPKASPATPSSTSSTTLSSSRLKHSRGPERQRAPVIRIVFEDAYNYMKSGTLMRQVINKINEIDFNRSEDRHMFGDIYEQILKDLQAAGNAGEFYTPRAVTQFIVEPVDPQLGKPSSTPPAAPAASSPAPSTTAATGARKQPTRSLIKAASAASRRKHLPHMLCTTNMLLHGIDAPTNVRHDNTLAPPLRTGARKTASMSSSPTHPSAALKKTASSRTSPPPSAPARPPTSSSRSS